MKLIINQIEVPLEFTDEDVVEAISSKLKCSKKDVIRFNLLRKSLDARQRRTTPAFILQAEVLVKDKLKPEFTNDVKRAPLIPKLENTKFPHLRTDRKQPIVIGAGPAGLMAALHLSVMGLKPILLERGSIAEERNEEVTAFWRSGALNKESNVLFGEGGAGLFSDGKLTARSKDRPRMRLFFETLVQCGAPKSILIDAEPHLGSDLLLKIVPKIRKIIEVNGGELRYNAKFTDITTVNNQLTGIKSGFSEYPADNCILATGHSARDVYKILAMNNVPLEQKPFAIGVRVEIPQAIINKSQYGKFATHKALGAANFKLTRRPEKGMRACYSFCMCPGGSVITCSNEEEMLTTNGMSLSKREGIWGNAAFLVPVTPEDFPECTFENKYPELAGLEFQEKIERAAYIAGGNGFRLPASRLSDFLNNKLPESLPENRSCRRAKPATLDKILPFYVTETLKYSIPKMLQKLNVTNFEEVIVYAAETRSSSPVRILRDENGESPLIKGLFPAGEGSGYAGGIVSSAIDGLKAAESLVNKITI